MKKRIIPAVLMAVLLLSFTGCELFWATAFPNKIVGGWDYVSGGTAIGVADMEIIVSTDYSITGWVQYTTGNGPDGGEGNYILAGGWNKPDKMEFTMEGTNGHDSLTWVVSDDTLTLTGTLAGDSCTLVFARWGT
jgi:hypothetical protein